MTPQGSALLHVWVQPGASRERVVGIHDGALKIAVTAPPEKGKANKSLQRTLARALAVPASSVTLVAGKVARRKTFRIDGMTQATLEEAIRHKGWT